MKKIIIYIFIFSYTILLFDFAAYISGIKEKVFPTITGRLTYPEGYFQENEILGHDIKPSHPKTEFNWRDSKGLIFSNRFGCFDKNEKYQQPIIYLAGDSVTWGYADYQKKFGHIIEKELKTNVAKCGVTHTGQKHQFEKLKNWISKTGIIPRTIFVTWLPNDIENDFLYPQSTVLKGKFVDQATIELNDDGLPIRRGIPEIDERLKKFEQNREKESEYTLTSSIIGFLKEYSATANIIRRLLDNVIGTSLRSKLEKKLTKDKKKLLLQENLRAIDKFIKFSKKHKSNIVFLVYSISEEKINYMYKYLLSKNQHVINYPLYLKEQGYNPRDTVWPIDGHPNELGNKIIAKAYLDYIRKYKIIINN